MRNGCRPAAGRSSRERGSGLILVLIVITMLLAFSAALALASSHGVRAIGVSQRSMRAFYLADSGVQVAIAKLRASEGAQCCTRLVAASWRPEPTLRGFAVTSTLTAGSRTGATTAPWGRRAGSSRRTR